jgi:hypothetical protein
VLFSTQQRIGHSSDAARRRAPYCPSKGSQSAWGIPSRRIEIMRKAIVSIITLAVLVCAADRAQAAKYTDLGKRTVSQIRAACSAAGAAFGVHSDGAGYGCTNENCDGKGGQCGVSCDNNNNCTGWTPGRTAPKSLHGVLTGGGQLAHPTGHRTGRRSPSPAKARLAAAFSTAAPDSDRKARLPPVRRSAPAEGRHRLAAQSTERRLAI